MRAWTKQTARVILGVAAAAGVLLSAAIVVVACGSTRRPSLRLPRELAAQARPIGRGGRFQPPATGTLIGRCRGRLGSRIGVHIELFAANRVVLVPAGIGTRPPLGFSAGRISSARCYGELVTLEPTGVVLVRPGTRLLVSDLFRAWGEPLSPWRLASFSAAGMRVTVFVDGRRWHGSPRGVPLTRHSEIVLEVGPRVPPHASYTFPPGT
jgi:hypothetical protein